MKRAADGAPADGNRRGPKQGRTGKFGHFAFKVLCPEPLVAKMMGNQGSIIHQIEEDAGCHLQFSPRGEYYPDTRLRVLVILAWGPQHIFEALTQILEQVVQRADEERPNIKGKAAGDFVDSSGKMIFRCALSKAAAGAVIGSKGDRIRFLRDSTGAMLDVARDVVDSHQLVTVGGNRDQLLSVLEALNATVQEDAEAPWFMEWAEHGAISAAGENAKRPRGGGGGGGGTGGGRSEEHRDCTIFVGHLAQGTDAARLESHFSQFGRVVDSDVRIDPSTGRSKGFGFITFAEPPMAEACFAQPEHEIDGRWVDVRRYGDNAGPGPEDEGRVAQQRGRGGDPPYWEPHNGYDDDGPHGPSGENRQDGIDWFAELAEQVPRDYLELDYCISCSLPSAKCGALIGRRGEHVAEVQRRTGASVAVSKKDPNEGMDAYRTVSITGPLLAVYAAHMLLMRHYNDEEDQYRRSQDAGGKGDGKGEKAPVLEDLQRQLTELSEELTRVRAGSGSGKGRPRSPVRNQRGGRWR